ncbi:unnamed protein product [Malus baccata var. baccata]
MRTPNLSPLIRGYLDGYTSQDHRDQWEATCLLNEIQVIDFPVPFSLAVDASMLTLSEQSEYSLEFEKQTKKKGLVAIDTPLLGYSSVNPKDVRDSGTVE